MGTLQETFGIGSALDAAAAEWYAKRYDHGDNYQSSPDGTPSLGDQRSSTSRTGTPAGSQAQLQEEVGHPQIGSDITAWQTAVQSLPREFKNRPEPVHALASALVHQPTLRQVEWNPHRHQGGFVPRTGYDFASLMIYVCGQINPNPCRNCLLKNGPFAQCVVSPIEVLANSSLRHACANCTYQNQHKRCNNNPISEEEMARSMLAKTVKKRTGLIQPTKAGGAGPAKSQKKREKERFRQQQQQSHVVRKPILQSSPGGSFAEKLCRVRSMSPRSRKQTNAEALQWQAAIATVEAERNGPMLVPIPVATAASKSSKARVPREAPVTVTEGPGHFAMFAPTPIAEQYSHELEGIEETEMSEDGGN